MVTITSFFSFLLATKVSIVITIGATSAEFCKADLITLVGSTMNVDDFKYNNLGNETVYLV